MTDEANKTVYALEKEIARLRDENRKLSETVDWMHDLIWKMVKEREENKAPGADSNFIQKESS